MCESSLQQNWSSRPITLSNAVQRRALKIDARSCSSPFHVNSVGAHSASILNGIGCDKHFLICEFRRATRSLDESSPGRVSPNVLQINSSTCAFSSLVKLVANDVMKSDQMNQIPSLLEPASGCM